jgi:hypothetical protein
MLLPPELSILLLLLTHAATAYPRTRRFPVRDCACHELTEAETAVPANVTITPVAPTSPAAAPELQDPSVHERDGEPVLDPCMISFDPNVCWPVNFIPALPSATGWETEGNDLNMDNPKPPTQTDVVLTTRQPTIVNVETNTAPRIEADVTPTPASDNTPGPEGNNSSRSLRTAQQQKICQIRPKTVYCWT